MAEMNWKELGLRCGIEIHQQLDAGGRKLFCSCPAQLTDARPDFVFKRRLRVTASELGQLDPAALEEAAKRRVYVYQGYRELNCLVELDEQPPNQPNPVAIQIAIAAAKALNMTVLDRIEVMRKCVIDGSNTSGFQRTALIGLNGWIRTTTGKVGIATLVLEEDSARIIEEAKESVTFRLDRLGIPLLEIATKPVSLPEQCKEAAEQLGLILRSLPVKRGIGTIRQDVNVSIAGGAKVEIKGVQELAAIPKLIELEARRQLELIKLAQELKARGIGLVSKKIFDVGAFFAGTQLKSLSSALAAGQAVLAARLDGFSGLLTRQILPGKSFADELADRAAAIAGTKLFLHSDSDQLSPKEVAELKVELGCGLRDAFVIVADERQSAQAALSAVIQRASQALRGVPSEVRKPLPDCTTVYERPMPGPARMYPETDIPPIELSERIAAVVVPELIPEKLKRYAKLGLSKDLGLALAKSPRSGLFDRLVQKYKLKPAYIAELLLTAEGAVKAQYGIGICPTEQDFEELVSALAAGKICKEAVLEILKERKPARETIPKWQLISDVQLEKELRAIIEENRGAPLQALMGAAMAKLRGRAEGKRIAEFLKRLAKS